MATARERRLERVARHEAAREKHERAAERSRLARDQAIAASLDAGDPRSMIGKAGNVGRQYLYKIREKVNGTA